MKKINTKKVQKKILKCFESFSYITSFVSVSPAERKVLNKFLKGNSKILDLCCGNGRVSIFLAMKGSDVVGVDLSKKMIKYAKSRVKSIKKLRGKAYFIRGDVTELNFKKNTFDYILIFQNSLEHIPSKRKREKLIRKLQQWLKPGGYVITSFHSIFNPKIFLNLIYSNLSFFLTKKYEFNDAFINTKTGKLYYHFFTPREVKKLFRKNRFNIVEIIPWKVLDKKYPKFLSYFYFLFYSFWIFRKQT